LSKDFVCVRIGTLFGEKVNNYNNKFMIIFIVIFILTSINILSEEERNKGKKTTERKENILVTASRIPTEYLNSSRNVIVITRDQIDKSPVESVSELLKYISGVDLRRRGPHGIQGDLHIRGSGFEQVLVLIDGVRFNNPQTGHHNLDIPVSLEDIDKIEILKGHGSSSYGPDALGGIINIITIKKEKNNNIIVKSSYGNFDTQNKLISLNLSSGLFFSHVSVNNASSDGYRKGTEYKKNNYFCKMNFVKNRMSFNMLAGYSKKKFGAYSFYSKSFPDQLEKTKSKFLNFNFKLNEEKFRSNINLYYNQHYDNFVLDKNRPFWYNNEHLTNASGVEYQLSLFSKMGITVIGCNFRQDEIKSSSLGNHQKKNWSLFFEHQKEILNDFMLDISAYLYNYSKWGWKIWPSIDLSFRVNEKFSLYTSFGMSFREPTYTELYYDSPANSGNPDLKPEKSTDVEIGAKLNNIKYRGGVSYFHRNSFNLIDWVRKNRELKWFVKNVSESSTKGIELNFETNVDEFISDTPIKKIKILYSYLKLDFDKKGYESKYILDYLKSQLVLGIDNILPCDFLQKWMIRYEERVYGDKYFIIDSKIVKRMNNIELFLMINNVSDKKYIELRGIPMPGRWIQAGLKLVI